MSAVNICWLIKELMREKGVKQKDMAKELGISFQRVSLLLKQDNLEIDTAIRVLEMLGCELTVTDSETGDSYRL